MNGKQAKKIKKLALENIADKENFNRIHKQMKKDYLKAKK